MPTGLDSETTRRGDRVISSARGAAGTRSGSLRRDDPTTGPIPDRWRTLGVAAPDGRPESLRRPRVAMGPHRPTAPLLAREQGLEILSPDAVDVPNLDCRQSAALDPVADGLPGYLEQFGDLLDCQDLGVWGRRLFGHLGTKIAKTE
jgi:hypothetical protein